MKLKFTKSKCPICNEITLVPVMFNHDTPTMTTLNAYVIRDDIVHGSIPLYRGTAVYVKECANCGFIAQFNANQVEKRGIL